MHSTAGKGVQEMILCDQNLSDLEASHEGSSVATRCKMRVGSFTVRKTWGLIARLGEQLGAVIVVVIVVSHLQVEHCLLFNLLGSVRG
eukprot:2339759-Rhodomonas_salina.2